MMIIKAWNLAKSDPVENIPSHVAKLVDQFSQPIKKKLTVSDVKEDLRRLILGKDEVKKKMRPLLTDSEIQRLTEGLDLTVEKPKPIQTWRPKNSLNQNDAATSSSAPSRTCEPNKIRKGSNEKAMLASVKAKACSAPSHAVTMANRFQALSDELA
ncbi:hypothetical protein F2Q70_00025071 [Brassica cretica]|uniref:Uncharacterized protein n=1 Tax=Brassica cretica TaxID=69181 RepID=A0A8S9L7M6_BRACR|nr:hypothetical protein F2Q70_00025071 [Brassica cretica]